LATDISSDLIKRLEAGNVLPGLSPLTVRLVELASDDRCSVKELSKLIEKDPSLTIRLLRLANSAFYRTDRTAATIDNAVVRVGFQQLRIMALSLSLRDAFPMGKVGSLDYERFWRTALYRALIAKALAEHLGTCPAEEAFVAGLTLGIGFLIFFDLYIRSRDMEIPSDLDTLETLLAWETKEFGIHHRQVGAAALGHWKFPETIVACQLSYGDTSTSEPLPRICESARVLANLLLRRSTNFQDIYDEAKTSCDIDHSVMSAILLTTVDYVERTAQDLKLEMDAQKDLLGLMEKANKALSGISEMMVGRHQRRSHEPLPCFDTIGKNGENQAQVSRTLEAVAHEIRNPLVAVAGFAKRLTAALDPLTKGGEYAARILQEALRLESALMEMTR
jgi:HD-like signal output (HDOD) protein